MAGLGTFFIGISGISLLLLILRKLYQMKWILWILMGSLPFPFIANTAGWMTAEFARQPWLIYNLMRTADGYSEQVSAGNTAFTLIGFAGMYSLLSALFLFLLVRIISKGPSAPVRAETH